MCGFPPSISLPCSTYSTKDRSKQRLERINGNIVVVHQFFTVTLKLYLTQYFSWLTKLLWKSCGSHWCSQRSVCVCVCIYQIGIDHYWWLYSFEIQTLFVGLKLMINICSTNLFLRAHYRQNIIFHYIRESSYFASVMLFCLNI